ncbi:helix-turn-helix domain-containing protein [Nonomuraea sp. NPDC004186]
MASWNGLRVPTIAARLGCHPETVRRRLHRFNGEGIDGLGDRPGPGRRPRLAVMMQAIDTQLTGQPLRAIVSLTPGGLDADFEPPLITLALGPPGVHLLTDAINPATPTGPPRSGRRATVRDTLPILMTAETRRGHHDGQPSRPVAATGSAVARAMLPSAIAMVSRACSRAVLADILTFERLQCAIGCCSPGKSRTRSGSGFPASGR